MKHLKTIICIISIFVISLLVINHIRNVDNDDVTTTQTDDYLKEAHRLFVESQFDEAYSYFSAALNKAIINDDKIQSFESQCGLGDCCFALGMIDSCIWRYSQASLLAKELNRTYDEYSLYTKIMSLYSAKADMHGALLLSQKIDSILFITTDARLLIDNKQKLANEAYIQQNFKLAEYYLQSAEIELDLLPDQPSSTLIRFGIYQNLRDLYFNTQDYFKANEYNQKCIDIWHSMINDRLTRNQLFRHQAIICAQLGKRKEAYEALDSMKSGLNLIKDKKTPSIEQFYETQGVVHALFGNWSPSVNSFRKALDNCVVNIDSIRILRQMSEALYHIGDYKRMKECFAALASSCGSLFGKESFEYSDALWGMANSEGFCGDFESGKQHYMKSVEILMKIVYDQINFVSVQEREAIWLSIAPRIWSMPSYALKIGERQGVFTEKCYEALLFSKGFMLESDRELAVVVNEECQPEEQLIYQEMVILKNRLKYLNNDYDDNKEIIDDIHQRISVLNKQLTPILSRLGYSSFLEQDYHDIKRMLDKDEVLLDFTDFVSDEMIHQYAAFVVDNEQIHPILKKSFSEEELTRLLNGRSLDGLYDKTIAEEILNLIWEPLHEEVIGKRTIYYVPSGLLHQISLESIPMYDGSFLGDHYRFVRLSSAREIKRVKQINSIANKEAVLYGALKYDVDKKTMELESSKYDVMPVHVTRGVHSMGNDKISELPASKDEINNIEAILKRNNIHVTKKTGVEGTEESFLSMSGKAPEILHIATHGFYYTPERAQKQAYLNGYNDAMMLSGLIMSGGNMAWNGVQTPDGVMDGILTANIIAGMNLKGTQLLVLSACQTGLGNVTPEGVYGLQRAFKKAGVQTIIMTLWDVKDDVTKEFMIKFYEELVKKENYWDNRKAFEKAKDCLRNDERYKDPYCWAGFVILD